MSKPRDAADKGRGKEGRDGAGRGTAAAPLAATQPQSVPQYLNSGYYYAPVPVQPAVQVADADYAHFMAQHGGQVAAGVVYEAKRATRQMAHYFDVNGYKTQLDQGTAPVPPNPAVAPAKKPTKKELEKFKKRREERKRIRNRWLFE